MQTIQQLEADIKDLQLRRATIEGQLRAARVLDEQAHAALVAGTGNADAAAQARTKVAPLTDALTALDSQIAEHQAQIERANAAARRDQERAELLEIAQSAAKLARETESEQLLASEELQQRAIRSADLFIELRATHKRFQQKLASFAGVQGYGDPADSVRLQQAWQEIEAAGASRDFMNVPENLLNQAAAVRQKPHGGACVAGY